ncbi:MAG: DUF308 domain-containing protein [Bacilli bacterium]|nr:DUF308 domain-containing protein [Bacilli bacterium]
MKKVEIKSYNMGESLFSAILFFILGIILFTNPNGVVKIVIYILGGFSILAGVFKLLIYSKTSQYNSNPKEIVSGVIYMLIGMATIICSIIFFDAIETVLRLGVAMYLLYVGLNRLTSAFKEPKANRTVYLINAFIIIAGGIALALIKGLPFKIVGLFIIGYSVIEIIGFFTCKKNNNTTVIKEAIVIEEKTTKEEQKLLK